MTKAERRQRARRIRAKEVLLRRDGYQFGQPAGTTNRVTKVTSGDMACMDASIQLVARIVQGRWYSLDFIRAKSGNASDVPMQVLNAARAMRALGLPYVMKVGLSPADIFTIVQNRGPVIIAYDYWTHPHWRGARYLGRRMRGVAKNDAGEDVRVGFARPLGEAGSTQWTFRDGHAAVIAFVNEREEGRIWAVRDPNHRSPARPERPKWDVLDREQIGRMLRSFLSTRRSLVWVPTKEVLP